MDQQRSPMGSAPNYTNAFLAVMGGLIFMTLWVVAAAMGFIWVVFGAAMADIGLKAVQRRMAAAPKP